MLVTPTVIAARTTMLTVELFKNLGIKGLIFDLDNTLMAPKKGILSDEIKDWLNNLRAEGFKMICVSNNKRFDYCADAEKLLDMPVIAYACKPDSEKLLEGLKYLQLPVEEVAVMGDRPLTDILGGQRIGAKTILVEPLMKAYEPVYIKGLRWLEWCFVKR